MTASFESTTIAPSVTRMMITPDMAIAWLEKTNSNNRPVSDSHVHRLARDMTEGRWVLTHEGIAFGTEGILLDGQHRLWAIVEAGIPIEMHVWTNVARAALMAIDSGKARSLADILHLGGGHGRVSTKEIAVLRAMLGGMKGPIELSPSAASKALERHADAVAFAIRALPRAQQIANAATRAVLARAYYTADRRKLEEFGRMLGSGMVMDSRAACIVMLRQHLLLNAGCSWAERRERYAKTQRALVSYLKGELLTRLYAAGQECFPLPEETTGAGVNHI